MIRDETTDYIIQKDAAIFSVVGRTMTSEVSLGFCCPQKDMTARGP